jgi:uncharacterized protein GlcG (DUF336 family)
MQMKKPVLIAIAAMFAGSAAPALAQKMLATYPTLTTRAAQQAAQAALARCQKDGYTVAVAVVDRGGQPLAVIRDNLAGAHTTQTAVNKAASAVSFRTDTTELAAMSQAGKPQSGIRQLPNVVAIGGGLMIRAKGSLVGGIGVSGAPGGDADDVCAKAGIAAINEAIEME